MNTKNVRDCVEMLRDIKSYAGFNRVLGLCAHCQDHGVEQATLWPIFEQWSEYSGNTNFPVAAPDGTLTPLDAYETTANKYHRNTRYGAARLRLAKFLADELERIHL